MVNPRTRYVHMPTTLKTNTMATQFVINPLTDKKIKVGGAKYEELVANKVIDRNGKSLITDTKSAVAKKSAAKSTVVASTVSKTGSTAKKVFQSPGSEFITVVEKKQINQRSNELQTIEKYYFNSFYSAANFLLHKIVDSGTVFAPMLYDTVMKLDEDSNSFTQINLGDYVWSISKNRIEDAPGQPPIDMPDRPMVSQTLNARKSAEKIPSPRKSLSKTSSPRKSPVKSLSAEEELESLLEDSSKPIGSILSFFQDHPSLPLPESDYQREQLIAGLIRRSIYQPDGKRSSFNDLDILINFFEHDDRFNTPQMRDLILGQVVWAADAGLLGVLLNHNWQYSKKGLELAEDNASKPRTSDMLPILYQSGLLDSIIHQNRLTSRAMFATNLDVILYMLKSGKVNPNDERYLENLATYHKGIARSLLKNPQFIALVTPENRKKLEGWIRTIREQKVGY